MKVKCQYRHYHEVDPKKHVDTMTLRELVQLSFKVTTELKRRAK